MAIDLDGAVALVTGGAGRPASVRWRWTRRN
jgi:hypothetical protein